MFREEELVHLWFNHNLSWLIGKYKIYQQTAKAWLNFTDVQADMGFHCLRVLVLQFHAYMT